MDNQIMKIAYVTTYDSSDLHQWSGTGYYIHSALRNNGVQTIPIGNLGDRYDRITRVKTYLYKRLFSQKYRKDREPLRLKFYAYQVKKCLSSINYDAVFSPGTLPIAYLRTKKPIIFWTDTTFAGMIDFYPGFKNLCRESIRDGNRMEQLALSKSCVAIYSSEWAADTATDNYDVNPAKVKVVPFGANIDCNRDNEEVHKIINCKEFDVCKLLFIGVDWVRKGGDISIKAAELLNQRGIKTEIHIVGCTPPGEMPSFAKLHGFVSKKTEEGRSLLDKLFKESHFLIMPSRAECSGIVFAEASSFGLPSIATKVGGIPTAIHDGKNGQTFALHEGPEKFCDYIERLMFSRQEYEQLAISSFKEYSERLNWESSGRRVNELIQEFCSLPDSASERF
jgi:glycosyltransferase involved in cell wall biosynthesis